MDNKISFGSRYDLSDKANLFSKNQRTKIKKLVHSLGNNDVVYIGTRKYKSVDTQTGKEFLKKEARVDYIVGKLKNSIKLDENYLSSIIDTNLPEKIKDVHFKAQVFNYVINILHQLKPYKSRNRCFRTFAEKVLDFDNMHNTKLVVRQWSRLKNIYNKDSFFSKIKDKAYKIKDLFTDSLERIVNSLAL